MKITDSEQVQRFMLHTPAVQTSKGEDGEFQSMLQESIQRSGSSVDSSRKASRLNSLSSIPPQLTPVPDPEAAVDETGNLLDLLDDYRKKLADPAVSLRELEPVVNRLAAGKERLSAVMAGLPGDDGLKNILNQALVTTSVEVMKYRRGDYLPS